MMKQEEQEKEWHLIRNDNGEWISDDYAVFLTPVDARSLKIKSKLAGKKVSIQHGPEGSLWCYKHEYDQIQTK